MKHDTIVSLTRDYKRIDEEHTKLFKNDEIRDYVLSMFNFGTIDKETTDKYKCFWNGMYLLHKNESVQQIEKCLLTATEKGHSRAANNLAYHYQKHNQFDKAKKYYLLAIQLGNKSAVFNLATFYRTIVIDVCLMKKYYLMAIDNNDADAMVDFATFLVNEKDTDCAIKYFLMALDHKKSKKAMFNLGKLYKHLGDNEKTETYLSMAAVHGCDIAMNSLALYYRETKQFDKMEEMFLRAIECNNCIAMNNLGMFYLLDNRNLAKAKKYLSMAVGLEFEPAFANYAVLCFEEGNLKDAQKYGLASLSGTKSPQGIKILSLIYQRLHGKSRYFLPFYKLLTTVDNPNSSVTSNLQMLEKQHTDICIFKQQTLVFRNLKNFKQCSFCCQENKLHLMKVCGHEMCVDCFDFPLKKCLECEVGKGSLIIV